VRYIRALESNEYRDLPADPYIRVYLRSLAKYLLLNPEEILKKFYSEQGINEDKLRKDSETKLTITMADHEKKKETKPWIIIVVVILCLALISLIAKKVSGPSAPAKKQTSAADSLSAKTHALADTGMDSLIGSMIPHDQPAPVADTAKVVVKDTQTLAFEIKVKPGKDSVWMQIFCDGVSWKNWMRSGQSKKFNAKDSLNVHVGNSHLLDFSLHGKPISVGTNDVAVFKIGHGPKQPEFWTIAQWNTVFKGRL
jgi:hypothetical protein